MLTICLLIDDQKLEVEILKHGYFKLLKDHNLINKKIPKNVNYVFVNEESLIKYQNDLKDYKIILFLKNNFDLNKIKELKAYYYVLEGINIKLLLDNLIYLNNYSKENKCQKYVDSFNKMQEEDEDIIESEKIEKKVSNLLHKIGVPAHIKGYVYIKQAVVECFYNDIYIGQITKTLYPRLALRYNSKASRIERAIRHAIEIAFNRGEVGLINEIFGYTISLNKAKPTNSEFIAILTDYLRVNIKKLKI